MRPEPTEADLQEAVRRAEAAGLSVNAANPYSHVTGPTVQAGGLLFGSFAFVDFAAALETLA
ncbi:MAG: hypothetical protein QOH47_2433 [Sphingomonadales bacterium]|jgi:hypothetical protein|nr:hypothetical protein [Sphingomonadales bacterium]